jgi:hypothetical protein
MVEPNRVSDGTVTLTWAIPLVFVKDCIKLTYVEFNVKLSPEVDCSVALKLIWTFDRGAPVELLSCTWKVTVWFGLAVTLPELGETQIN